MTTNEYMDDITRQAMTELAGQLSDDLGGRLQERIASALDARGEALDTRIGQRLDGELGQFRQAWEERFTCLAQELDQHLKAGQESRAAALAGLNDAGQEVRAMASQTRSDLAAIQERMAQTESRLQDLTTDQTARIDALSHQAQEDTQRLQSLGEKMDSLANQSAGIEALRHQAQEDTQRLQSLAEKMDGLAARNATCDNALQAMRDDAARTDGKLDHLLADIQEARKSMADGISGLIGSRFDEMAQKLNAAATGTVTDVTGRLSDLQATLTGAMDQSRRQMDAAASQSANALSETLRTMGDELRDRFESAAQEIVDGLEASDKSRHRALSASLVEQGKSLTETLNLAADQRSAQIVDRLNEKADGRASAIQAAQEEAQTRLDALAIAWKKEQEQQRMTLAELQETQAAMGRQLSRLQGQNLIIAGLFAVLAVAFIVGQFL